MQPESINAIEVIDASITPEAGLDILSKSEVFKLLDNSQGGGLYPLFRRCALAVLNCGHKIDDMALLEMSFSSFDARLEMTERGVRLALKNAPVSAFVEGKIIRGISDHLFSVVRDIIYAGEEIMGNPRFDLNTSSGVTDAVFHILRNAGVLNADKNPRLVVCWGGYSISQDEYIYTKKVGYEAGLRGLDICTGCGPGAMKGPMKGATIGHAKQRIAHGQYLGITEPGIIAAEPPNPIVNTLVIMPDIEKRLEAFLRLGHAICIFPGGVGTMEEILYVLGVLMDKANVDLPTPLILTGPESSRLYFDAVNQFIADTLGLEAQQYYQIIIGQPSLVAHQIQQGIAAVRRYRKETGDAYYFNWRLTIPEAFQKPFDVTHENVKSIALYKSMPVDELAVSLRKIFSAIVVGTVKESGIRAINQEGPFEIKGDASILASIDTIITLLAKQRRLKLVGDVYQPCYKLVEEKINPDFKN